MLLIASVIGAVVYVSRHRPVEDVAPVVEGPAEAAPTEVVTTR